MAMNPLKEMVTSNKNGRSWYVLNEKGERAVIGPMDKSALRVVFTERLDETVIPQGIPNISYGESNRDVGAIGGRNMILEGERYLHSAAGKGLR